MITNKIITVLRSGGEYNVEHVAALYRNLLKSLTVPFTFHALTDVAFAADISGCNIIPLITGWDGWWSKLELFRPGLFATDDNVVYMDLDTVLVGNVDWLFKFEQPFTMLHGFKKDRWASGLMAWRGCPDTDPYTEFDYSMRSFKSGDQAFIMEILKDKTTPGFWHNQFPGKVLSYKHHARHKLPANGSVVCFHGRPRPWDVDDVWVKEARA